MKYLLTGGTGTLGTELQKHFDCFIPDHKALDITWSAQKMSAELKVWSQIKQNSIKAIIHAAAYTDVPQSELNKKLAIETNIIGTKNVVELARMWKVPVVYISTDYVYEGIGGQYKETDQTRPFNFYGFTKLGGSVWLDSKVDLEIRTSFKPNDLWNTKYDSAFTDLYTSADYADVIAKEIAFVIKTGITGAINVGTERKSLYDLAIQRATNTSPISVKSIKSVKMPRDISMDLTKLNNLKTEHDNE